jgi:hypothetical protein
MTTSVFKAAESRNAQREKKQKQRTHTKLLLKASRNCHLFSSHARKAMAIPYKCVVTSGCRRGCAV